MGQKYINECNAFHAKVVLEYIALPFVGKNL